MLMPASNVLGFDGVAQSAADVGIFPVVATNLSFARDRNRIIEDLSFRMEDVPCTAIIGANGAGKSVLLRLLHGLLQPTAGSISWGISQPVNVHQQQAMVFQKPVLLKRSVAANLSYVLRRRGLRGEALDQAISTLLALANLTVAADRSAHVLSGGEAQRLAIVRALATQPRVLLLDEPSASLDPNARSAIESLLSQTMAKGVRVLLVTQDIGQAARLADEVLVLHEGRLAEQGPAQQVLTSPRSVEASRFLNHEI